MSNYLNLLRNLADQGSESVDRTGDGTIRQFGVRYEHDLKDGEDFPLLTTKKVGFKSIFTEMMWFLSGNTSIIPLHQKGVHIWDADMVRYLKLKFKDQLVRDGVIPRWKEVFLSMDKDALENLYRQGYKAVADFFTLDYKTTPELFDLGKVYGHFWKNQVQELSTSLSDIVSELSYHGELSQPSKSILRRLVISGWHPEVNQMVLNCDSALPPCHALWQIGLQVNPLDNGKFEIQLDLEMFQRSADSFLGVPYNIASYAFLMLTIARTFSTPDITFKARKLGITFGDFHIYKSHINQVNEQLSREPRKAPMAKVEINSEIKDLVNIGASYFDEYPKIAMDILNYEHHGAIRAPLIVGDN